jgi:hypothetical protein
MCLLVQADPQDARLARMQPYAALKGGGDEGGLEGLVSVGRDPAGLKQNPHRRNIVKPVF